MTPHVQRGTAARAVSNPTSAAHSHPERLTVLTKLSVVLSAPPPRPAETPEPSRQGGGSRGGLGPAAQLVTKPLGGANFGRPPFFLMCPPPFMVESNTWVS